MSEHGDQRSLVSCVRDQAMWRQDLNGRSKESIDRRDFCILETPEGEPVGFFTHFASLWRNRLAASIYELEPGVSWLAATPTVVRYLWAKGRELAVQDPKQDMEAIAFWMGEEHPVYQVFRTRLPQYREPYAWYMRVPDLAGFLRHISPVLEQRLAESVVVGHRGELLISFYRDGLRLVFEEGRLVTIEQWMPSPEKGGTAAFPDLTFLQILFGFRALEELDRSFADCWTETDEARILLEVLFPKKPSDFMPIS